MTIEKAVDYTKPTKEQIDLMIDHQFKLFTDRIRPRLTKNELQTLAAFVTFQKSGDTDTIPGDNSFCRIEGFCYPCADISS